MKEDLKFLFIGDSITDGNRSRVGDPNHILGHGFAYSVGAQLGYQYAELRPKFYNRGSSGENSWQIRQRWQEDALDIAPDVVTILCGINDTFVMTGNDPDPEHLSTTAFEGHLRYMIESLKQQNPEILIMLGVPFFYGNVNDLDTRFQSAGDKMEQKFTIRFRKVFTSKAEIKTADITIRQEIVRKLAAEYGTLLLDTPALFEECFQRAPMSYWCWDGTHPTCAMHQRITEEWLHLFCNTDFFRQKR